jgi:hypothetical protein
MPEPLRVNDTRAPPDFELISGRRLIALEYLSGHLRGTPACWVRLDVAVRLVEEVVAEAELGWRTPQSMRTNHE